MKKLFILCLSFVFISCEEDSFIKENDKQLINMTPIKIEYLEPSKFWDLRKICKGIYWETNTDIIYRKNEISGSHAYLGEILLPIYKADGTLLTYTEWQEKNNQRQSVILPDCNTTK